jgi:hypothetical protein
MATKTQLETARLRIVPRSADLTIRADAEGGRRYAASFIGTEPTIRETGDTITVEYPRFRGGFSFRESRGELRLGSSCAWEIHVEGGVSKLVAELSGLPLRSIEIAGGASDVRVVLPEPVGVVPVRIRGGASKVGVQRPRGVAARLAIMGGTSKLAFDAERLGAVGGEIRLASPGAEDAAERYDIEVGGGASELTVTADGNGGGPA